MGREITSKNIDGITDLVVVAPIREGFIDAYENVTYATRLQIVAEALNRVRVAAREHEDITPFSDVTERILTLLDFRIGVIDKDLFGIPTDRAPTGNDVGEPNEAPLLVTRRFLYLTATFDGAWEPYMRLIWKPLGPFLDLLFCNCEGYVTATEHSFEEYAQWVRDNQVDSAIFYAATGLGIRDHLYLSRLEQVLRARPASECDREIAGMTMPNPELAAMAERALAGSSREQAAKIHELALEALTVLYRLADFYPPEWMVRDAALREGRYLVRVAESLLLGWEQLIPKPPFEDSWKAVEAIYADPLRWYRSGIEHLRKIDAEHEMQQPADPAFDPAEVQGGILKPQGSLEHPMRQGALLLMTIREADAARQFLARLDREGEIDFPAAGRKMPTGGFFRTVALTASGLRRLGLDPDTLDWFPKEFREGMEMRSGLVGDVRENHPRRWKLPPRNWPPAAPDADASARTRPPIETSEIDIVVQIRTANEDPDLLVAEIARLAQLAGADVPLQGYESMCAEYDPSGLLIDYFGFHDGVSQPRPAAEPQAPPGPNNGGYNDEVRLGEIFLGYRNDRDDFAPAELGSLEAWRQKERRKALGFQSNGTFLVIRKLEQKVETFEQFIAAETKRINEEHPHLPAPMTEERLKARMLGRYPDGRSLIRPNAPKLNDFNYAEDPEGTKCPLAAHARRANPREAFQKRNSPRILRRGMSFDQPAEGGHEAARGLMFMAYNASIAEQYEAIQRWLNGGNSTHIASGHNDPLLGVAPKSGALHKATRVFRFVEGNEVIRVAMPEPFVKLHWGLYLFVPSRAGLRQLCELTGQYQGVREALETHGRSVIAQLRIIRDDRTKGMEWKRLLEDVYSKDPAEGDITPDVWSAIRWHYGGSFKIPLGFPLAHDWNVAPDPERQPIVLSASYQHVMRVLSDWRQFTTEEQLRRIDRVGIPIFVTQQPDDQYKAQSLQGRFDYRKESEAANAILMGYDEEAGFQAGYGAGKAILDAARRRVTKERPYYKLELRRQYILPALGGLCKIWYGLPDGENFHPGAWTWQPPVERSPRGPRCPGDFLSPSRNTFYPRPTSRVEAFAEQHGEAISEGIKAFIAKHRAAPFPPGHATIAQKMFQQIADDEVLARNLIGTMIGAIPPMDGNLRGILFEWLNERTLWRHQAALRRALGDRPAPADFSKAREILFGPVSQAMCKRPSPDLLYRTALGDTELKAGEGYDREYPPEYDVPINERDLVVVSLVSAAQRSLTKSRDGDVSIVFGGKRREAYQGDTEDIDHPVHACPAQKMAMGAIMGILAALLDAGRLQALPASLILRIEPLG